MKTKRTPVVTVETCSQTEFEEKCRKLFEDDYKMVSSSCSLLNSEEYQFVSNYMAIFQDKNLDRDEVVDDGPCFVMTRGFVDRCKLVPYPKTWA
jgi:hypothetical protein